MLKVAKFGGSSMADAEQYKKVKDIILSDPARKVIVVSAAGKRKEDDDKITDLLYLCYAHIQYGVDPGDIFQMIAERYREICRDLSLSIDIEGELRQLKAALRPSVSRDWLVSRGEYFSARLLADYLKFDFVDSVEWVKFNLDGTINQDKTYRALRDLGTERRMVTPGFYGVLPDGRIRTMSRGGSDITGALAAAALDANIYENWTDVSGILMADPRIVDHPDTIRQITYPELRALSYMGAQVLHEGSIAPVREKHIPLNIRNTNDPTHPGTVIMESFDDKQGSGKLLTGIAGRRDFTIVTIHKSGMSNAIGILRSIMGCFADAGVNVEHITSGIDSVSLAISSEESRGSLYTVIGALQKTVVPEAMEVTEGISMVAAVGRKMVFVPGSSGALFAALGRVGVNVRMITQEPEELNIVVGVNNSDFEKTIQVIYESFVKQQ